MAPFHIQKLLGFGLLCLIFLLLLHIGEWVSLVDSTIEAWDCVLLGLLLAGEAVDVALADDDLFLPIKHLVELEQDIFVVTACLRDHLFELDDRNFRRLREIFQVSESVIDFVLSWEGA